MLSEMMSTGKIDAPWKAMFKFGRDKRVTASVELHT